MSIPFKTVERLSKYRRALKKYKELREYYIFSHDLAAMLRINPVQVRRDLMLIGFTGNYRNGYNLPDLLDCIERNLPKPQSHQATIIGMGEMGQTILNQIHTQENCPILIPFTFDTAPENIGKTFTGIPCYELTKAPALIQNQNIKIALLTSKSQELQEIANSLSSLGIECIINCTFEIIKVPKHIVHREMNIISILEEIAFLQNMK